MLRRLILFAAIGIVVGVIYRIFKAAKARALPSVPDAWLRLADDSTVMREALELRDRLHRVIDREDQRVQRALLLDVHAILESLADLVQVQADLEQHIRELKDHPDGRRPGRPLPAREKRQRAETVDALESRADRLAQEAHQAVGNLRSVYMEMLRTFEAGGRGGAVAVEKTRALIDDLRAHARAEREIRDLLHDDDRSESDRS